MNSRIVRFAASVAVASWSAAPAQTLLEPDQAAAAKSAFESARRAPHLRCDIHPGNPALNYGLQFQSSYVVDVPLAQFGRAEATLKLLTEVTPEGKDAVYFSTFGTVPAGPAEQASAEVIGGFVVGEGNYSVSLLVSDDFGRACLTQWRLRAVLAGAAHDLRPTLPPGAVQELGSPLPSPGGPPIDRLTILVHAVAMNPRSVKIEEPTIRNLSDSISALLAQLPVRSARLVVFNLERQLVLYSKENFAPRDLDEVSRVLEQVQLGILDVKTVEKRQRADVLSELALKELRNPKPPGAVILLGPRTIEQIDSPLAANLSPVNGMPWYYLQYQSPAPARSQVLVPSRPSQLGPPMDAANVAINSPPALGPPDGIERLVHLVNGVVLPVRAPLDLAIAIHRMAAEIPAAGVLTDVPVSSLHPKPPPTEINADTQRRASLERTGDADPAEVLARLRDRVLERGAEVPNHTCVESVQRDQFTPLSGPSIRSCDYLLAQRKQSGTRLRLDQTDWLRLDVGIADNREVFSWAGAPKFDDREIDQVIPDGAFGTGPFASLLLGLFTRPDSHFLFDGDTTLKDEPVLQYSFHIPRDESHYRIRAHKQWLFTGYMGTLLVDPKSGDLKRFFVRTEQLPPESEMCEVDTTLDYAVAPPGSFSYLLPVESRQRFIGTDGAERENTEGFTECREFFGESTLMFGPEPAERSAAPAPEAALSAGTFLDIELTSSLVFGKAAAGDRIEGRLLEPARDEKTGRTVAPAGTKVGGRLTRVELRHSGSGEYVLALKWEWMQTDGGKFRLAVKAVRPLPGSRPSANGLRPRPGTPIELPPRGLEDDAFYRFSEQTLDVPGGLRTRWVTVAGQ